MDKVYLYDGSFVGLLNLIMELIKMNERPYNIKDELYSSSLFETLINFDIPWDEIEKDYNVVVSSFNNTDKITRNDARTEILRIIDENNTKFLSNSEIDKIKDSIRVTSKWETLKKGGVTAIPSGDATKSFETINKKLKKYGIYIVTEGELENFIKAIGGHGPDWVNKVLEAYPNLNDDIYSDLRKFVIELDLK